MAEAALAGGAARAHRPRVVVIDSGVDPRHPDVRGRGVFVAGPAFADDGGCVPAGGGVDDLGHGTAVAAVILRHAPDVELVAVRVFDSAPACALARVLGSLGWAIEQRPAIVNLSLGITSESSVAPLRDL